MNVKIRARNLEITPSIREHVEKKLSKFDRLLGEDTEANVSLLVVKDRQRVEVTIPLNGFLLRGEEETDSIYSAMDLVLEKLERQIHKYKTRLSRKGKKGLSVKDIEDWSPSMEAEETDLAPVRVKRFLVKPLAVEEAIMQMNLLGHNFFVFANQETDSVNVVYRGNDGGYGLLQPEL